MALVKPTTESLSSQQRQKLCDQLQLAIPTLEKLLSHSDELLRDRALESLLYIGLEAKKSRHANYDLVIAILQKAASNPHQDIRKNASWAVEQIESAWTIPIGNK